jgi:HK97 family phage prohead protease
MDLITKQFDLSAEELVDGEVSAYLTTFENSDLVGDVIKTGALDDFVAGFDPELKKLPMLYEHSTASIIGEWKSLEIDEVGLKGTGILYTETSTGKDVQALLKRKALASVSIGFRSSSFEKNDQGGRNFKSVELVETSIVLNPCNTNASVLSVKSEDGMIETKALKTLLKDAGLTRSEINALFDGGWKSLTNLRVETEQTNSLIEALKNFKL